VPTPSAANVVIDDDPIPFFDVGHTGSDLRHPADHFVTERHWLYPQVEEAGQEVQLPMAETSCLDLYDHLARSSRRSGNFLYLQRLLGPMVTNGAHTWVCPDRS